MARLQLEVAALKEGRVEDQRLMSVRHRELRAESRAGDRHLGDRITDFAVGRLVPKLWSIGMVVVGTIVSGWGLYLTERG